MLSKVAIALISPLGTFLALALLSLFVAVGGWRRLAKALLGFGLIWLTIWSLPTPSLWLRGQVEMDYPEVAIKELPRAPAIVVLGGGVEPAARKQASPNLLAAADRVWYASRLYRAGKAPLLVLSGGSDPTISRTSEADAMRALLLDLGVPSRAMLLEDQSLNTRQNATFTARLLRERKIKQVILVTSALHMRRARELFEKMGIKTTPAPTDHEMRPVPAWRMLIPGAEWLEGSGRAMKEIVGALMIGA